MRVRREVTALLVLRTANKSLDEGCDFSFTNEEDTGLSYDVGLDEGGDQGDAKTNVEVPNDDLFVEEVDLKVNIESSANIEEIALNLSLTSFNNIVVPRQT